MKVAKYPVYEKRPTIRVMMVANYTDMEGGQLYG